MVSPKYLTFVLLFTSACLVMGGGAHAQREFRTYRPFEGYAGDAALPADYRALEALCEAAGATLIADAEQSFGARQDNRPVGILARLIAF